MINPNHPQTRQEAIDYMAPERTATDGQWLAMRCLGAVAGIALIAGITMDTIHNDEDPSNVSCPAVVNSNDMPECK